MRKNLIILRKSSALFTLPKCRFFSGVSQQFPDSSPTPSYVAHSSADLLHLIHQLLEAIEEPLDPGVVLQTFLHRALAARVAAVRL